MSAYEKTAVLFVRIFFGILFLFGLTSFFAFLVRLIAPDYRLDKSLRDIAIATVFYSLTGLIGFTASKRLGGILAKGL